MNHTTLTLSSSYAHSQTQFLMQMGLLVHWYDFICFGIVGVAFVGAFYVIWKREGFGRSTEESLYESLVVTRSNDTDNHCQALAVVGMSPRGHVSMAQLSSSCWRGLHPLCLLSLRFASFVILSCILAWDLYKYGPDIYIYYTEWTFSLVIVYFAIGTIESAYGCIIYYSKELPTSNRQREDLTKRDTEENLSSSNEDEMSSYHRGNKQVRDTIKLQSYYNRDLIQQRAGFWGYLMQTAYQTCAGAVIITDLVFWCIIVPFLSIAHLKLDMLMGCMHTLNLVFLLVDAAVNSLAFPWFRLAYFVLWSCCYVILIWIIHACGYSTWPYPFLELSIPWAPLWYFCFAVAHIPCYGLFWLLVRAKNSYFPRLFPEAFAKTF